MYYASYSTLTPKIPHPITTAPPFHLFIAPAPHNTPKKTSYYPTYYSLYSSLRNRHSPLYLPSSTATHTQSPFVPHFSRLGNLLTRSHLSYPDYSTT